MPLYSYHAVSLRGENISGQESGKDEKELARSLREKGFVAIEIKEIAQGKHSSFFALTISSGVSLKEKLMFIRNLKVMVSAGVALPKALDVLTQQATTKIFQKTLMEIKEKILQGSTLSQAMEMHASVFPDIFTNMIKVGEESGTLEDVLFNLSVQLEKQHDLKSKIMGALMYPAIVLCAMMGIGVLMLVVVVPILAKVFKDLRVPLPITTQFIIALGTFLSARWYVVLGMFGFLGFAFFKAIHTVSGKRVVDTFILKVPVISGIIKKTNSALTLRTLSSLMASGIPIVRSLEITSKVLGNSLYRDVLTNAAEQIGKGAKLSEALKPYTRLYPLLVVQMVEVGEETGQSAEVLGKLAEFFESEVEQVTQNLASVLEPILMLVVGGVVGFFAVSMIQPMYSMLTSLENQ